MNQIRVATFDGPGAEPVIRTVPRPKIGPKAALIEIGACGSAAPISTSSKGTGQNRCPGRSRSGTSWQA